MPSFSLRRLVITTMLLITAFAAVATSAQARLMWTANAELPWNQEWANYSCQDGSRVKETGSVVAQGGQAYEIEVRDGDDAYGERCELGQGNPTRAGFPLYHPGDERVDVSVPRIFFNTLAGDPKASIKDWVEAYDHGHVKVSGEPAVVKLIGNVIERQLVRAR